VDWILHLLFSFLSARIDVWLVSHASIASSTSPALECLDLCVRIVNSVFLFATSSFVCVAEVPIGIRMFYPIGLHCPLKLRRILSFRNRIFMLRSRISFGI
jgi:hypothetical protein